jgi:hypothetical protein
LTKLRPEPPAGGGAGWGAIPGRRDVGVLRKFNIQGSLFKIPAFAARMRWL